MSDVKLLDKAAKAAGGYYDEHAHCFSTDMVNWEQWEPLDDDGDAFRLLAKVKLSVDVRTLVVTVEPLFNMSAASVIIGCIDDEQSRLKAARRAIVQQAAAMADWME